MPEQGRHLVYESGGWELDLARRELRARGIPVPLGSRAFSIFAVLVQSAGKLVTRDEDHGSRLAGCDRREQHTRGSRIGRAQSTRTRSGNAEDVLRRGYRLVSDWTIQNESVLQDPIALEPTRIPVQPVLSNLPAAAFEVIGRTAAVQQLQDLLSAYRAVTLTGPGGIGKTTLALEVARSLLPAFDGECWLVDVASLSDPDLVPSMVARILGLKLGGDEISPESVARAIGGRKLLLVSTIANTSSTLRPNWRKRSHVCVRPLPSLHQPRGCCGSRANRSIAFCRWRCRASIRMNQPLSSGTSVGRCGPGRAQAPRAGAVPPVAGRPSSCSAERRRCS